MKRNIFTLDDTPAALGHFKQASVSIELQKEPGEWELEVLEHLYKTQPWLSNFAVNVEFIKKDVSKEYGVGSAVVTHKQPLVPAKKTKEVGVLAHIPVVVKDSMLAPMDLFVCDENVYPLQEEAFMRKIVASQSGSGVTNARRDPTLIGHLWPPSRSSYGSTGGEIGLNSLSKFSSLSDGMLSLAKTAASELRSHREFPLLSGIVSGTFQYDPRKVDKLAESVSQSQQLQAEFGELLAEIKDNLPSTRAPKGEVAQAVKVASGYFVRSASANGFSFGRGTVVTDLPDNAGRDTVLLSNIQPVARELNSQTLKRASSGEADYGSATVGNGVSNRYGMAFRNVVDFEGSAVENSLFMDSQTRGWSMESTDLPILDGHKIASVSDPLSPGVGVFVVPGEKMACTLPVTIHGSREGRHGTAYIATVHQTKLAGVFALDMDVKLMLSEAVKKPLFNAKEASLVVPATWQWKGLQGEKKGSVSALDHQPTRVDIVKLASDEYQFTGAPVQAITHPLDYVDSELLLAVLGVAPEKIASILERDRVSLTHCRNIRRHEPASTVIDVVPDTELLKAASVIGDESTVDAVLGLNLLDFNLEDEFYALANNLEMAQQKVAKLLLLSRLGMEFVPEGAAKVVMLRLTPIIDSLKVLALNHAYAV